MSSSNSATAAMPSSSTNTSSGVRLPLSLDQLKRYICQEASNRAEILVIPPGFIGPPPPPPSSAFIGQRYLVEGPSNETTVRVMFHCVSPPNTVSRHVLMHMKPSVSEEALASKLCQVFNIPATGGVITKTMPEFVPGLSPLTDSDKVYSFAEMFGWLSSTMAGFMEVTVVSVDQMSVCTNCGNHKILDAATLKNARKWCFGVNNLCGRCCRTGAIADNVIEMSMPDGKVLPVFHH